MNPVTIKEYCNSAWTTLVQPLLASFEDPKKAVVKFSDRCLEKGHEEDQMKSPMGTMCFLQTSGDKFIPNLKKNKKAEGNFLLKPIGVAIQCITGLAKDQLWVAFKSEEAPKAVGLSAEATPIGADAKPADASKAADLPNDATPADAKHAGAPKAVGLPSDVTPAADASKAAELSTDVTPTVAKPVATSNDTAPSLLVLKNRLSVIAGAFFDITPTGLSVNNAEPKIPYASGGFVWGRAGGLITPAALSAHLAYTTFVGIQGEGMPFSAKERSTPYSNDFNVWGVGPAVSGLFVYDTGQNGFRIVGGPDLAFLLGSLSSKGPIDVGIPDRLYVAQKPRFVGTALAGLSVGFETPADKGGPSWMLLLGTGLRWFFHGDQVTDTPPGYEGTMVRLNRGPLFDYLKFSMGFNY